MIQPQEVDRKLSGVISFRQNVLDRRGAVAMEVVAYRAGPLTQSPLDFYICLWPSNGSSAAIGEALHKFHAIIGNETQFPLESLKFGLWRGGNDRRKQAAPFNLQNVGGAVASIDDSIGYFRVDGPFFGMSLDRRRESHSVSKWGFCSSFALGDIITQIYMSSNPLHAEQIEYNILQSDLVEITSSFIPPSHLRFYVRI